jgi:hypothetical protein
MKTLHGSMHAIDGPAYFAMAVSYARNMIIKLTTDVQHYKAGDSDDVYAEIRPRRDRVTHSRTTSGERPTSAPHSEDQGSMI